MRAALLTEVGSDLEIAEIALRKPGRREVLIRTSYCGICHSDLHFIEGVYQYPLPCVLGHEAAGVVEAVGEDVTHVVPGDHVVTCISAFCGHCTQCVKGHTVLCEDTTVKMPPGVSDRLSIDGERVHQFFNLSGFAEAMLVHEQALVKVDRDLPLDRAALLGCAVLTGAGAVFNAAKVTPGSTVAVIGCGGVGLAAINGAAIAGASRIIAIDVLPEKLEIAKEMGATDGINASETDPVAAVQELTRGGVDFSFECLGIAATVEQSFKMLHRSGTATVLGMVPPGKAVELLGQDFLSERRIQGAAMGSNHFRVDIPMLGQAYQRGLLKLDHLVSGTIPLERINEGFATMKTGNIARQLVAFN